MFKILLLLALASCAKLNLNGKGKSGKNSETSKPTSGPDMKRSWSEGMSSYASKQSNANHSSSPYSSSGSRSNGKKS